MKKVIPILLIGLLLSNYSNAADCSSDEMHTGRAYGKVVTRVQVDDDGWVLFKFEKTNGNESDWLSIDPDGDIGKQSLSLLLTSLSIGLPISYYLSSCSNVHGGGIVVKAIQIHK